MPDLVPLPGSERGELPVQAGTALDPHETITVTLVLRRRADIPDELVTGPQTISASELASHYGASPEDVALVQSILGGMGLTVTGVHAGSRHMKVSGTVAALSVEFGQKAYLRRHPGASTDVALAWAIRHRSNYHDHAIGLLALLLASEEE